MKRFRLLVIFTLATVAAIAQSGQIDFSNPALAKWGATPAEREQNMLSASFMREALDAGRFDEAAKYFQQVIASAPTASDALYARAALVYKNKIAGATSLAEKRVFIDSLMIVHDLRMANITDHPSHTAAYYLDIKARDYFKYNKVNREGLREVYKAAIEAGGNATASDLVMLYFQNLCDDYSMDEVMADEVIAEYERLSEYFDAQTGADAAELKSKFDNMFGTSGVASCENLEAIYAKKIEAEPTNEKLLLQAVRLLGRTGCKTPFYVSTAEKYYEVNPSPAAAMELATIFQNDSDFAKATKYLRDALAESSDMEEQEALYSRIALIELAASDMSAALTAARAAIATEDGTLSDNGIALFVVAQCYGASAAKCEGLQGQIAYLAAYDAMQRAINNFSADEANYKKHAVDMMGKYKQFFPTTEECFFNEIPKGSSYKVECGVAKGESTIIRTRD